MLVAVISCLAPGAKSAPSQSAACAAAPPVRFPAQDQAPLVAVYKNEVDGLPPKADCLTHGPAGSELWVSVAGTAHRVADPGSVLARFGQISQMRAIRYWSISDHLWRPLLSSAAALTTPTGKERADFSLQELESGSALYYEQADSRSARKVVYELRLLQSSSQGFVLSMVNISPLQWWGMTLYKAGDLDTVYFLEHAAGDEWHFHSLSRMPLGNHLLSAQDGSYINRAVAMYRFLLGIPTDSEPPAVQ